MAQVSAPAAADLTDIDAQTDAHDVIAVVKLADEYYGISAEQLREIVRVQEITEVPNSPAHVEGVINLRGRIVPVVDLRKHFGLPWADHSNETRIVVTEIEGEESETHIIGLIVDGVDEILTVTEESIDDAAQIVSSVGNEYIRGIVKLEGRLVILLDINRAF